MCLAQVPLYHNNASSILSDHEFYAKHHFVSLITTLFSRTVVPVSLLHFLKNHDLVNPFVFIRNRRSVIYQRVSLPLKKRPLCVSRESCAVHPDKYIRPLQIVLAVLRTFFYFELAGSDVGAFCRLYIWRLARFNFKKSAPNDHYYLQRAATPEQITQQNSLQKAGGP